MRLKKMLSLTLIFALMCSLLAAANCAAADFSVNGRNGWSVSAGSGIVGTDGGETVVKLVGTANVALGGTYTGALLVTANMKVTGGEATISAMNGETLAASGKFSAAEEYSDAILLIKSTDNTSGVNSIKFEGSLNVKSIKVEKADIETSVFVENFDSYVSEADISSFESGTYENGEKGNLTFTAAEDNVADKNIESSGKVGHLYDATYITADTIRYDDAHSQLSDAKSYAKAADKAQETWAHYLGDNFKDYSHVKLRFKYYNAWNAGKSGDTEAVRDALQVSFSGGAIRGTSSDAPYIEIQGTTLNTTENDGDKKTFNSFAKVQKWSDVEIDMNVEKGIGTNNRNRITYSVTIDGVTTGSIVHTKASDFKYLHMAINKANGGGFYIDDVEVAAVDDLPDNYDDILYSEDFENGITKNDNNWVKTYGSTTSPGGKGNDPAWSFYGDALNLEAVEDPAKGNCGKVGKLEKLHRANALDAIAVDESGAANHAYDIGENKFLKEEYWALPLNEEVKNANNITLSYKYYDTGIARKYNTSTGAVTDDGRNQMSVILSQYNNTVKEDTMVSICYENGKSGGHTIKLSGENVTENKTKQWNNVSVNLKKETTADGKISVTETCGAVTKALTMSQYNYLILRVLPGKLGQVYIDDIKITTPKKVTADVVAQNILDNLSKETVYSFTSDDEQPEAYEILNLTYQDGSADVTFRKWMDTTDESVRLYVASYDANGNMLECAVKNLSDIDKNTLSNKESLTLKDNTAATAVKAFILNDNLKPLAMHFVTAISQVNLWIASDSIAQNYDNTYYPQTGWGEALKSNLFSSAVTVQNCAVGSRSSKSFIEENRLQDIMSKAESGDYLLVSFAYNDFTNVSSRMALTGKEETDPDGYKYWLKKYIDACAEKSVNLVFVTAPPTYNDEGKNLSEYAKEMKEMASAYNIPVIDVYSKIKALDDVTAKSYYMIFNSTDYTNDNIFNTESRYKGLCDSSADGSYKDVIHFRKEGAAAIAGYIANDIKHLPVIGNYVK